METHTCYRLTTYTLYRVSIHGEELLLESYDFSFTSKHIIFYSSFLLKKKDSCLSYFGMSHYGEVFPNKVTEKAQPKMFGYIRMH